MTAPPGSEPSISPAPFKELTIEAKVMRALQDRMRPEQFVAWFRGVSIKLRSDNTIDFEAPNGFHRDWIARNYGEQLREIVAHCVSGPAPQISFSSPPPDALGANDGPVPAQEGATPPAAHDAADQSRLVGPIAGEVQNIVGNLHRNLSAPPAVPADPQATAPSPAGTLSSPASQSSNGVSNNTCVLNRHYTFEEFVIGPCNKVAHAAAAAIGTNLGHAYNPFFVHGNIGLGKTHLLQAICHAVLQNHPSAKVIFLSCEEFTNRFIEASQNRALEEFRNHYRSADLLVIDDVEFLAQKVKTQAEFFHTFNELYNRNKQIVMSSDRSVPEIPTLEERLVSRFKWGFEAQMERPCIDTRVSIVHRKANVRSTEISDDVARFIAERVNTNIRELEGAVIKVLGLAAITNKPIDIALATDALAESNPPAPGRVTLASVMDLVTNEFSLSAKDITGKSRTQAISSPRQIAMHLSRTHTEHSLQEIGRFFGNRDHTTVLYALSKVKSRAEKDPIFHDMLAKLSARLLAGDL
ncbi:MAG: chromosomal replication initiator protein DnaA [Planctomycetota bacterium]